MSRSSRPAVASRRRIPPIAGSMTCFTTRWYSFAVVDSDRPSTRYISSQMSATSLIRMSGRISPLDGALRSAILTLSSRVAAAALRPVALMARVTPSTSRKRVRAR